MSAAASTGRRQPPLPPDISPPASANVPVSPPISTPPCARGEATSGSYPGPAAMRTPTFCPYRLRVGSPVGERGSRRRRRRRPLRPLRREEEEEGVFEGRRLPR